MEKKIWTCPAAIVEQFMPSEYVAACWTVACAVPTELKNGVVGNSHIHDGWDGNVGNGFDSEPYFRDACANSHNINNCGKASNQSYNDITGNMYENNSNLEDGTLLCTIEGGAISNPVHGAMISWTNSAVVNGVRQTWHHYGYLNVTDDSNPGRS